MAGDTSGTSRELDQTPTWAVAGVCAIIIIISITLEKVLHKFGKVLIQFYFNPPHKSSAVTFSFSLNLACLGTPLLISAFWVCFW
ncbi:hypothetical protein LguiB_032893 [Lonicera macranthoides]